MFYDEDMKKKAKRVNFIEYLKKYHPDAVQWKLSGYVYKKEPWVAFFQGRDGEYRYYDNLKAKYAGAAYCGDGMKFLTDYLGGYTFLSATKALLDFEEELKKFQPSLEVEELGDAIYQDDLTDMTDLLREVIEQTKQDDPQ